MRFDAMIDEGVWELQLSRITVCVVWALAPNGVVVGTSGRERSGALRGHLVRNLRPGVTALEELRDVRCSFFAAK